MNPFAELYKKQNVGDPAEKYENLADAPSMIDIEPVGLCNFRCNMCPTGLNALGRPGNFMTDRTFDAIISKVPWDTKVIRFIGWGEPLMHKEIVPMVRRAARHGLQTHINTNGSYLTRSLARDLVAAGLASIKFSFQGTDRETYQAMRGTDFFDGMIEAIKMMEYARGKSSRLFIAASTTTTDETPEMIAAFKAQMDMWVDELSIGRTIFDFIEMDRVPEKFRPRLEAARASENVTKKHPDPCPEVFQKLTIHWNGDVRVCCNDYSGRTNLGNIRDNTFDEIWRHPTMEEYRQRLARKEYGGPLCSNCFTYMGLQKSI